MAFKLNESRAHLLSKEIDAVNHHHLHTAHDAEGHFPINIQADRLKQIKFNQKSRSMYSQNQQLGYRSSSSVFKGGMVVPNTD